MAAMIPSGELAVQFGGQFFKIWTVRYDGTATTFDVNLSVTSIIVILPASSAPTVSLGASANGIKTATIAAGGSASSDGTVTIVTAHGASLSSSSVG